MKQLEGRSTGMNVWDTCFSTPKAMLLFQVLVMFQQTMADVGWLKPNDFKNAGRVFLGWSIPLREISMHCPIFGAFGKFLTEVGTDPFQHILHLDLVWEPQAGKRSGEKGRMFLGALRGLIIIIFETTPPKTNMSPQKRPFQKESCLPTC